VPRVARQLQVINRLGLHLRPAAKIAQTSNGFRSLIALTNDGKPANAKSIMSVATIAASQGTWVTVEADGDDAEQAVAALEALFAGKFGED
jgi:phosphocarrier protein HPr